MQAFDLMPCLLHGRFAGRERQERDQGHKRFHRVGNDSNEPGIRAAIAAALDSFDPCLLIGQNEGYYYFTWRRSEYG